MSFHRQSIWKTTLFLIVIVAASATLAFAQTLTTLATFDGTDGSEPYPAVVQGTDGNFYGTTVFGGSLGNGEVFKITPAGKLVTLYSFTNGNDGRYPYAGLLLGLDGNFYGTTGYGGANNFYGTVFKITPKGVLTTLHAFDSTDGASCVAALIQASNGIFYGTTESGGANGYGTVFKMTSNGTVTTLHSFDSSDGAYPMGSLYQGTDGNFYGTTYQGGADRLGTVFKITPTGTFTSLHSFSGYPSDGTEPYAGLVQAANGSFYGTTWEGGTEDFGSIFKMTSTGTVTLLHSLNGGSDGGGLADPLIQATDGNLYGTANSDGEVSSGCTEGCGTIFKISTAGTFTVLEDFDQTNGAFPFAALLQGTNGILYGTTQQGGPSNEGTVYSLSLKLGPFVSPLPTSGKVGAKVVILGNNLTGSTAVSFNGTAATFTVVSNTEITATVPSGATTGKIEVTTPHATLKSNVSFRVTG